jgi:hypothetical protein
MNFADPMDSADLDSGPEYGGGELIRKLVSFVFVAMCSAVYCCVVHAQFQSKLGFAIGLAVGLRITVQAFNLRCHVIRLSQFKRLFELCGFLQ